MQVADYAPGADFGPRELHRLRIRLAAPRFGHLDGTPDAFGASEAASYVRGRWPSHGLGLSIPTTGMTTSARPTRTSTSGWIQAGLGPTAGWPTTRSMTASPVLGGICDYLLQLSTTPNQSARERSDQLLGLLLDHLPERPPGRPGAGAARLRHLDDPRSSAGLERWETCASCRLPSLRWPLECRPGTSFRVFRAELGCGPARALELVRLARSAATLQRSNASLAAVAAQHGFANAYHFSRRFSQAYRMPPGTFRALGLGPDPLEPVRRAGLLPFAAPLMSTAPS